MDDRVAVGLFRHGLTMANINKQFCGWTDVPVAREGFLLLQKMNMPDYDWIVSSDLKRCVETAAVFWDRTPHKMEGFREFHFGEWENKTHIELEHDITYKQWLNDPFAVQVPGGDSYPIFAARIEEAFQAVLAQMDERNIRRTAIVTHGGAIRHLLSVFAPEKKSFSNWTSDNGHGFELSGSLSAIREGKRCISLQAVPSTEKRSG